MIHSLSHISILLHLLNIKSHSLVFSGFLAPKAQNIWDLSISSLYSHIIPYYHLFTKHSVCSTLDMAPRSSMKTKLASNPTRCITRTNILKGYNGVTKTASRQISKECNSTRLVVKLNVRHSSGEIAKQAVLSVDKKEYLKKYANELSPDHENSQESTLVQEIAQTANDRILKDSSGSSTTVYNSIETD